MYKVRPLSFALLLCVSCAVTRTVRASEPANFIYTSEPDLNNIRRYVTRSDISGVQIIVDWKQLEPKKDVYSFTRIERALQFVNGIHKKLFVQVQDRFFQPNAKNVPGYLMEDPLYKGGIVPQYDKPGENRPVTMGWVVEQWNPYVRQRFQLLLQALAAKLDGRIYGLNLPETAIDINQKRDKTGFTCDGYFQAEMDNMEAARRAFTRSYVVQYVNVWPCEWNNDHGYMSRIFDYAARNGIGLGGPDVVPYRKGQMKNAYPFFHEYKDKLIVIAMAVQEPTLTYINPKTGKQFTRAEFQDFAANYLGAKIIFWATSAPWLNR